MKNIDFALILKITPLVALYFTVCATLYNFIFWQYFKINIFTFTSPTNILGQGIADLLMVGIVILFAVPFVALLNVGELHSWFTKRRGNLTEDYYESWESSRNYKITFSYLKRHPNLYLFFTIFVFGLFGIGVTSFRYGVSIYSIIFILIIFVIGMILKSTPLTDSKISFATRMFVFLLFFYPVYIVFFAFQSAYGIKEGLVYQTASTDPCSERFINKSGDFYFFYNPEDNSTRIVSVDRSAPLTLYKFGGIKPRPKCVKS